MFGFKSRSDVAMVERRRMVKKTTLKRVSKTASKKTSKTASKKASKKTSKKASKKASKKTKAVSKPIVCGSIKNRNACLRLNRKCKYSTKTKRCQRR